jgi:hypothetical protein
MTAILIAGVSLAALVILGAYIRWAVGPAAGAYQLGVTMGPQLGGSLVDEGAALPAREVTAAWLMPRRAARRIRVQQGEISLLIRAFAYAVAGGAETTLERERPSGSEWYDRPLPIAVLAAVLSPGRAVRKLRSSDDAIAYMVDAMLAQERKQQEAGELAASSK